MRYATSLIGIGSLLLIQGVTHGGWGLLLAWPAVNFLTVGIAYLRRRHGVFGKQVDGRLSVWRKMAFFPFLALTSLTWHLARWLSREPTWQSVNENLVIGRRLLAREVPGSFSNYVDLTAELEEPRAIRGSAGYLAFPILDASAPHPDELAAAVARLKPGSTFIHCAQGHGRTGLFALALLLSSGAVKSAEEGLGLLRGVRPEIRFSPDQRRCIELFARGHSTSPGPLPNPPPR